MAKLLSLDMTLLLRISHWGLAISQLVDLMVSDTSAD